MNAVVKRVMDRVYKGIHYSVFSITIGNVTTYKAEVRTFPNIQCDVPPEEEFGKVDKRIGKLIEVELKKIEKMKKKLQKISDKIVDLDNEFFEVQGTCSHIRATCVYGSDTGNWCRNEDRYWATIECPDCQKTWVVDSDSPDYTKYPKFKE